MGNLVSWLGLRSVTQLGINLGTILGSTYGSKFVAGTKLGVILVSEIESRIFALATFKLEEDLETAGRDILGDCASIYDTFDDKRICQYPASTSINDSDLKDDLFNGKIICWYPITIL